MKATLIFLLLTGILGVAVVMAGFLFPLTPEQCLAVFCLMMAHITANYLYKKYAGTITND